MDVRDLVPALGLPREERVALLTEHYAKTGSRGPRGLAEAWADSPLALLCGDATPVLDLLRAGERPVEVAARFGVGAPKLYEWLMRNAPEEWASVSAARALDRLDQADGILDEAGDKFEVHKAAVMQRGAQWTLERLAPALYGTKGGGAGATVVVVDRTCRGAVEVGGSSVFEGEAAYGSPGGGG